MGETVSNEQSFGNDHEPEVGDTAAPTVSQTDLAATVSG